MFSIGFRLVNRCLAEDEYIDKVFYHLREQFKKKLQTEIHVTGAETPMVLFIGSPSEELLTTTLGNLYKEEVYETKEDN